MNVSIPVFRLSCSTARASWTLNSNSEESRWTGCKSASGNETHIESIFSFGFYCVDWNLASPLIITSKLHTQLIKPPGALVWGHLITCILFWGQWLLIIKLQEKLNMMLFSLLDELWLKRETELGQAEIAVLQETLGWV